jgi:CTP synthase (UTP-ammonia lyase)
MTKKCRVALVGDCNPAVIAHRAIPEALRLAGESLGADIDGVWLHTSSIHDAAEQLAEFDAIWCVPASPYANADGALDAIRFARERRVPYLGTCGGFQHAVIEYARNVLGMKSADNAEDNPQGETLVITPLSCSLIEKTEEITLAESGMLHEAYGAAQISEGYHCSYGINPAFAELLFSGPLRPTAHGASGEVRAFELQSHPFFVGTLFQPERRALMGEAPPLVVAFLKAMD